MDLQNIINKKNFIIALLIIVLIQNYIINKRRSFEVEPAVRYSRVNTEHNENIRKDLEQIKNDINELKTKLDSQY